MSGTTIVMVDPATVVDWVQDGKAVIVDVRETHEFKSFHIDGALSNPLSTFNPNFVIDSPLEEGKNLVFHCHSGMRCGPASDMMRLSGFQGTIHRMTGGIVGWHQAGGPLVQG